MKSEKIQQSAQVTSFTQEIGPLQNIKLQIYKTQLSMCPCCNKKQIEQEMGFGECAETKSKRKREEELAVGKVWWHKLSWRKHHVCH